MALSKATWREALSRMIGDWWPTVASSGGAGGGTTWVANQYAGLGSNFFRSWWTLITSGTYAGHYYPTTAFDGTTGTGTIAPGPGGAIAQGVTMELHAIRPDFLHDAANRAIRKIYPRLYSGALDGSITLTSGTFEYALPAGITPDMITQVMEEGDAPFSGLPRRLIEDVSYSPDQTKIWLNRTNGFRYQEVTTGKKLYLFTEKYLTSLDKDTVYGQITTDSTGKIELVEGSGAWELLLLYGRAMLFSTLASQPQNDRREEHLKLADAFLKEAEMAAFVQGMERLESREISSL